MSNLPVTVTFTVIFFLSFLSHSNARTTLTVQPSNLLTEYKSSTTEDDSINLIRLPTDINNAQSDVSESETDMINNIRITRPLTVMYDFTLRPVNRHFHPLHIRQPFWYHRFPLPCHYHGRHVAFDPREVLVGRESGPDGAVKDERVGLDLQEAIVSQKSGSDQAIRGPLKEERDVLDANEVTMRKESGPEQAVRTPFKEESIASDPREMTVSKESGSDQEVRAPVKEVGDALNPREVTMTKESTSDQVVHPPVKQEEQSKSDQQEVTVSKESGSDRSVHVPMKEMRVVLTPREVAMRKRIRSDRVVRSPARKEEKKVTLEPREVTMSKESGSDRAVHAPLKEKKFTLGPRDLIGNKKRGFGRMVPVPMNEGRDNKEVVTGNKLKGGRLDREAMLRGGEIEREKLKEGKREEGLLKKVRKFLNQF